MDLPFIETASRKGLRLAQSYAGDAPGKIPPSAEKDMRMSKRKEKLDQNCKGRRKLIKARHEESARLTEFDIFALRENGEEDAVIGGGSFEGVNLEYTTATLTQLAHSLGCDLQWQKFADLTMEEFSKRQHLSEEYRTKKDGVPE